MLPTDGHLRQLPALLRQGCRLEVEQFAEDTPGYHIVKVWSITGRLVYRAVVSPSGAVQI